MWVNCINISVSLVVMGYGHCYGLVKGVGTRYLLFFPLFGEKDEYQKQKLRGQAIPCGTYSILNQTASRTTKPAHKTEIHYIEAESIANENLDNTTFYLHDRENTLTVNTDEIERHNDVLKLYSVLQTLHFLTPHNFRKSFCFFPPRQWPSNNSSTTVLLFCPLQKC